MEPATVRIADRLAQALHRAGVRHAFGMPGGEVITFVDALEKAGIRFVLARNESAAAMMAAATCRDGAAPGLLVTTLGPGLANAVNGIADAWQERVPLIVVSGVVDHPIRARYTHQVVDHRALLAPLVKASFEIEPAAADATLARALRLALTPPFGPVHLDLAPGIAALSSPSTRALVPTVTTRPRIDAHDPALGAVRERIARAERPLILAGFEAARSASPGIFADIATRHGIPVLTTYKAKGLVDETEPLSLGAAGLSPLADGVLLDVVRRADLVLLAGYDPIEMRQGWLDPVADPAHLVDIGAGSDHAMHEAGLRLVGPPDAICAALFDGLPVRARWSDGEPARARARLGDLFAGSDDWGPHAVFDTLQTALPADTVVGVDSGAHRILLSQRWRARTPLTLLQSAGWCTMGSALPLAIGASLQRGGARTVAVLGDGGLEMTLGELGTLRDQKLPVTVLVLQDESLALIALKQDQAELARAGVSLGATDFARIAEAFGGTGVVARDRTHLHDALAAAQMRDGFTLIACPISAGAYVDRI